MVNFCHCVRYNDIMKNFHPVMLIIVSTHESETLNFLSKGAYGIEWNGHADTPEY